MAERLSRALVEMGHSTLITNFSNERIDDETVLKLTDTELNRLGLNTIGDRHRFREKMRVDIAIGTKDDGQGAFGRTASHSQVASNLLTERNRLFGRSTQIGQKKKRTSKLSGWTGQFFCLGCTTTEKIPTTSEKEILIKAGLGLKKVRLENDDDESEVMEKLMSSNIGFPKLAAAGGFELLRSEQNCRTLKVIGSRWNSKDLKCNVGSQVKIYIRPIQNNLSLQPVASDSEEVEDDYKTACDMCSNFIPVRQMREHLELCGVLPDLPVTVEDTPFVINISYTSSNVHELDTEGINVGTETDVPITFQSDQDIINMAPELNITQDGTDLPDVGTDLPDIEPLTVSQIVDNVVKFCSDKYITDPVEVLKKLQNEMVTGRSLEIQDLTDCLEGDTNYILVDRSRLLESAFDELSNMTPKQLRTTLEVQFYDETAEDYGGPRKEFFRLVLKCIKEKYFDNGLRDLLADDYVIVGIVFALSILQNGPVPNFLGEDVLNQLIRDETPSTSILKLRQGLNTLGIYEVVKQIPSMEFLFHATSVTLSVKKLTTILQPVFSENGSNNAVVEKAVYGKFVKYTREVASGRRRGISLNSVLSFTTGVAEEPVLGFSIQPSITFLENKSLIPTAHTCINRLILPRPAQVMEIPNDEKLFELYDLAFANEFFGLK